MEPDTSAYPAEIRDIMAMGPLTKKLGRSNHLTENGHRLIEAMSAIGSSPAEIGLIVGHSTGWVYEQLKNDPEAKKAQLRGQGLHRVQIRCDGMKLSKSSAPVHLRMRDSVLNEADKPKEVSVTHVISALPADQAKKLTAEEWRAQFAPKEILAEVRGDEIVLDIDADTQT